MSDFDPLDIAGQEADAAARAARNSLSAADIEGDTKWLMADPRGRRIARRLLERTGVFRSSFDRDAAVASFREGERNVGLMLLGDITQFAPAWLASILIEEHHERRRRDDHSADGSHDRGGG